MFLRQTYHGGGVIDAHVPRPAFEKMREDFAIIAAPTTHLKYRVVCFPGKTDCFGSSDEVLPRPPGIHFSY